MTQPALARQDSALGRVYWSERGRTDLPSITNVIGALDKPFLPRWAAKLSAEYAVENLSMLAEVAKSDPKGAAKLIKSAPWESRDRASERGNGVHDYLEAALKGEPLPELTGDAAKHKGGIDAFLAEHEPEARFVEVTVFSERYGYAGTFDFILFFPHLGRDERGQLCIRYGGPGMLILGDLKTSKAIYASTSLQLAANRFADRMELGDGGTHPVPEVAACVVLRTHTRGYELREVRAEHRDFVAFRAALNAWHWQKLPKNAIVGDRIPRPTVSA